jgi:hypothetical protein
MKLSDQIADDLVESFKRLITERIKRMSSRQREIAIDLLKDPVFMAVSFIVSLDPEKQYPWRLEFYRETPFIRCREHLFSLMIRDKRVDANKVLVALIHDFDRCYSVDQRKLHGAKESVLELKKIYSEKVLQKLDQGIFYKDWFPSYTEEMREDEKGLHFTFHLYSKPKNRYEFENLFDLIQIWSTQDAYLNREEPTLFEKQDGHKDIQYLVYDPDGKCLNYKRRPYSAFLKEKYRPLVKAAAREYVYRSVTEMIDSPDLTKGIKHSQKEVEDLAFQGWFEAILNYRKGRASIPAYLKQYLYDFFFPGEKIEQMDYDIVPEHDRFIEDFVNRSLDTYPFKDKTDEIIGRNFDRTLLEIQEAIQKELNREISLTGIFKRKEKLRKPLQRHMEMARIIVNEGYKPLPAKSKRKPSPDREPPLNLKKFRF